VRLLQLGHRLSPESGSAAAAVSVGDAHLHHADEPFHSPFAYRATTPTPHTSSTDPNPPQARLHRFAASADSPTRLSSDRSRDQLHASLRALCGLEPAPRFHARPDAALHLASEPSSPRRLGLALANARCFSRGPDAERNEVTGMPDNHRQSYNRSERQRATTGAGHEPFRICRPPIGIAVAKMRHCAPADVSSAKTAIRSSRLIGRQQGAGVRRRHTPSRRHYFEFEGFGQFRKA